jgi:hypothetical protein
MAEHDTELVIIATFPSRVDAELAQGALEAARIDSLVQADDAGGMQPGLWMSGIGLLVRAEDADRASRLLAADARPHHRNTRSD